jgi:hypothetical protein
MLKSSWLTLVLMVLPVGMPLRAQPSAEQQVMDLANADRAQQGLAPLAWDAALVQAAADHAQLMAQQGALSHQYAGEPDLVARGAAAGAHFRSIAENVALAPNPQALEREWMNSAPHRANILNPLLNTIGIGLVKRGGNYYAVEDFADTVAELGPEQIEQQIGNLLLRRGLQPAGMTQDARQTCEMDHGAAGGSAPRFIMRWEGTDLGRLPEVLEQKITTRQYHKAAVGACDSGNPSQGFTTYKIAVMLY